ncbi:uncharacterized protein BROUX77_007017 [Berkeleyomyces rouxiae]|uniref:uncharacterized protein n=1 Tax=Berkeleyomyces rouxiae TaxID=2035830 RepID=UPI003B7C81DC
MDKRVHSAIVGQSIGQQIDGMGRNAEIPSWKEFSAKVFLLTPLLMMSIASRYCRYCNETHPIRSHTKSKKPAPTGPGHPRHGRGNMIVLVWSNILGVYAHAKHDLQPGSVHSTVVATVNLAEWPKPLMGHSIPDMIPHTVVDFVKRPN